MGQRDDWESLFDAPSGAEDVDGVASVEPSARDAKVRFR